MKESIKIKSFNEFVLENSYQGGHHMEDDLDFNATIDDMTKNGELVPLDFYDKPHKYGIMNNDKIAKEILNILNSIRNNPDSKVTIYRAVTKNIHTINPNDWVTLSKDYATQHNNSNLNGEGHILSLKCRAKDVQWNGDDVKEMGYCPQK